MSRRGKAGAHDVRYLFFRLDLLRTFSWSTSFWLEGQSSIRPTQQQDAFTRKQMSGQQSLEMR